jgi:hypothetical protein
MQGHGRVRPMSQRRSFEGPLCPEEGCPPDREKAHRAGASVRGFRTAAPRPLGARILRSGRLGVESECAAPSKATPATTALAQRRSPSTSAWHQRPEPTLPNVPAAA